MEVRYHADIRRLRKYLKNIGKNLVPTATVRALNRAAQQTQTAIKRKVSIELGVKQKQIRRRVRFGRRDKAKTSDYRSGVFLVISALPVSYLGTVRQTRPGAKVKGKLYKGAFKATMSSGHIGVFRRLGKKQHPIKEVKERIDFKLMSIAENEANEVGVEVFRDRFFHELQRMIEAGNG